jgi:hypothetical protein
MNHLTPCPECGRHVRASEPRCPFCDAERDAAPAPRVLPNGRLSRAATLAFGAMIGAAAAVSCGGDSDDGSGGGDAGESAGGDADDGTETGGGPIGSGGILVTPVYGAPTFGGTLNEPDPGSGGTGNRAENGGTGNRPQNGGTGNRAESGGTSSGGRMTVPRGGTANAGSPATGGQLAAPVYGAPPEPAGGKPASGTGGRDPGSVPMPVYGAPPPSED